MARNMRETKMHYNNASGRDGVFIVEVSRGIDCQHIPEIPVTELEQCFMNSIITNQQQRILMLEKNEKSAIQQQKQKPKEEEVQIHQPPRDVEKTENDKSQIKLQQIIEVEEEVNIVKHAYTGLSQSDLSSSSSSSSSGSNKCYNYGNQSLYTDDCSSIMVSNSSKMEIVENKVHADKLHLENVQTTKEINRENKIEDLPSSSTNQSLNAKEILALATVKEKNGEELMEVKIADCNEIVMSTNNNNNTATNVISNEIQTDEIKLVMDKDEIETEVIDLAEKLQSHVKEQGENTMKSLNEELPKIYTSSELLLLQDFAANNEKSSFNEATFEHEQNLENNNDVDNDYNKLLKVSKVNNNNNDDNNLAVEIDIIDMEETISEKGCYDSLMSLPEPPSFEEIKQLNDSSAAEQNNNQLDSLTLPPPPPPAFFMTESQVQKEVEEEKVKEDVLLNKQQPIEIIENIAKNEEREIDGMENRQLPNSDTGIDADIELNVNNDREILSTQLTPPESPPHNNCINRVGNGLLHKGGICSPLTAVAVDVNGS